MVLRCLFPVYPVSFVVLVIGIGIQPAHVGVRPIRGGDNLSVGPLLTLVYKGYPLAGEQYQGTQCVHFKYLRCECYML